MAHRYVLGLVFLFLVEINSSSFPESTQPRAKTQFGGIYGSYKKSFNGRIYRAFEGVPYALPLINENRFKESVLYNLAYKGILNATSQAAPCLHHSQFHKEQGEYTIRGSEDCLYLNIYVAEDYLPYLPRKPVVINFNPGGFGQTGSDGVGPDYLMDKEDIVLVTFNYRLGPFGFLSTGDSVVPGNMGLKDQIILMRWVKDNIKDFGGDPGKVTIFGMAAGGASVHYHLLSPLSAGLFHRAFSLSGTALCPWALIHDVPDKTKELASLLGCPTESTTLIVDCLRERPAHVIVRQLKHFQVWLYNPFTIFGPVVEGWYSNNNFLPEHPADISSKSVTDVPWIVSVTEQEGLYPGAEFVYNAKSLGHLNQNWKNIAPYLLFYNHSTSKDKHDDLSETIKWEYLKGMPISMNSRQELIQMLSDRLFIAPNVNSANLVARKNKSPVYFYVYSQKNSISSVSKMLSKTDTVLGSAQGDDYSLLIKLEGINTMVSNGDQAMSGILMNILTTFADTGRVPPELAWQPLPPNSKLFAYLNLRSTAEIQMKQDPTLGNKVVLSNIFKDEKSTVIGGLP